MSELMECAVCHAPTTKRCSRCKLLLICSRECMQHVWKSHKRDCKMIQLGRAASPNGGANPETMVSIPLAMREEEFADLFAPCDMVCERYRDIEDRLVIGDKTLKTQHKVQYYSDLLQVLDTSGKEHETRSLVQQMALNRRYNIVYKDATKRLAPSEVERLHEEMQRRRIGAFFKQQG